jgi:beta-carotene/zeaxanthin 4-ketolase
MQVQMMSIILSFLIISSWLTHLAWCILNPPSHWLLVLSHIWFQSFLTMGLFIVAHDCMHGNVQPLAKKWQHYVGSFALVIYAGFSFKKLRHAHMLHHKYPASSNDPDYINNINVDLKNLSENNQIIHTKTNSNENFFVWLKNFTTKYFGWKEFLILHLHVGLILFFAQHWSHLFFYFAIPSWISALQLFYFGTYLPHRNWQHQDSDEHKARSNSYSILISLLACYHFGYHHEHHIHPSVPWWDLPRLRWK